MGQRCLGRGSPASSCCSSCAGSLETGGVKNHSAGFLIPLTATGGEAGRGGGAEGGGGGAGARGGGGAEGTGGLTGRSRTQ